MWRRREEMRDCVLGLDACRNGWITAVASGGKLLCIELYETAAAAVDDWGPLVCAIDIPMHLNDRGRRTVDFEARKRVWNSSTVFNAPCLKALDLDVGKQTPLRELNEQLQGHGCARISQQTRNLIPKIREVKKYWADPRVFEVHPEVLFHEMARQHNRYVRHSKKTWNGLMERISLLDAHGLRVPESVATRGGTSDDVADAVACLWSGLRIARRLLQDGSGKSWAVSLPPECDVRDRNAAIWY